MKIREMMSDNGRQKVLACITPPMPAAFSSKGFPQLPTLLGCRLHKNIRLACNLTYGAYAK
jgi:hypothetical protein